MRTTWTPTEPPVPLCTEPPPRVCHIAATVRSDWTMPAPPPGGPWRAVVHDTGDGWSPSWESEDGDEGPLLVGDEGWPFVEDSATGRDWEAVGFEVV